MLGQGLSAWVLDCSFGSFKFYTWLHRIGAVYCAVVPPSITSSEPVASVLPDLGDSGNLVFQSHGAPS